MEPHEGFVSRNLSRFWLIMTFTRHMLIIVYLLLYVDDILIIGRDSNKISNLKANFPLL